MNKQRLAEIKKHSEYVDTRTSEWADPKGYIKVLPSDYDDLIEAAEQLEQYKQEQFEMLKMFDSKDERVVELEKEIEDLRSFIDYLGVYKGDKFYLNPALNLIVDSSNK